MGCHPQKQLHSWHHRLVMTNASYTLLSQVIVHSPVLRLLWGASPHFWRGPYSPRKNETPCQVMKMAILGFSSVDTSYLGSSAVAMHPVTHNEAQPPPPPLGIMPSHTSQGKAALLLSSPTLHRTAAVAFIAPTSKVLQPLLPSSSLVLFIPAQALFVLCGTLLGEAQPKHLVTADRKPTADQSHNSSKSNLVNEWAYWSYLQKQKWLKDRCTAENFNLA